MAIIASRRKLESVSATRQSRLEANSAAAIAAQTSNEGRRNERRQRVA